MGIAIANMIGGAEYSQTSQAGLVKETQINH